MQHSFLKEHREEIGNPFLWKVQHNSNNHCPTNMAHFHMFLGARTVSMLQTGKCLTGAVKRRIKISCLIAEHVNHNCRQFSVHNLKLARGRNRPNDGRTVGGSLIGSKIEDLCIDKALGAFHAKLSEFGLNGRDLNLYIGTGQYFDNPKRDRVLVLHSASNFDEFAVSPNENPDFVERILDCSLPSSDIDQFSDELGEIAGRISSGEINSVNTGNWTHGFVIHDVLKIFSHESLLCKLFGTTLQVLADGKVENFPAQSIESLSVMLSEEPWNEQAVVIGCKGGQTVPLLTFSYDNDNRDLAMLMVDTEWSVKVAALLCLKLRSFGNKEVQLKLPKVLTVQGNPWVENRHNLWTRFSNSS